MGSMEVGFTLLLFRLAASRLASSVPPNRTQLSQNPRHQVSVSQHLTLK